MKSEEIKQLLEIKNCLLEIEEYITVMKTSSQINNVEYLPNEDKLHATTDDGYDFKFKIYNKARKKS